jgi:hypothetical protein
MGTAKNPDETGHAFHLAEAAKARSIVTIGVGDGGSEIGNGLIYDAARQIQPYGLKCQCDCEDGAYAAQVLYVGGTSALTQRALVAMLREIIDNGLKTVYRGF